MTLSKQYILGIDPGTNHYSAALIELSGKKVSLLALYSYQYNPKKTLEHKLKATYNDFAGFLKNISPDVACFEAQYFGGNARVLRSLCESVGAMKIGISLNSQAEIFDYTPNEIKLAFTGKGNASKEDMIVRAQDLFKINPSSDEADAIGVAMTYIVFSPIIVRAIISDDKLINDLSNIKKLSATKQSRVKHDAFEKMYDRLRFQSTITL